MRRPLSFLALALVVAAAPAASAQRRVIGLEPSDAGPEAEPEPEPKADDKKADPKADGKKADDKKADPKADGKKADDKKADPKADDKKPDPKADPKKADPKKKAEPVDILEDTAEDKARRKAQEDARQKADDAAEAAAEAAAKKKEAEKQKLDEERRRADEKRRLETQDARLAGAKKQRRYTRTDGALGMTFSVEPGAIKADDTTELRLTLTKKLDVAHPRYGFFEPQTKAGLTATVTQATGKKDAFKRTYALHPLSAPGTYGFHVTLPADGAYQVVLDGKTADGKGVNADFTLHAGVWPPPDFDSEEKKNAEQSIEAAGGRRAVVGGK